MKEETGGFCRIHSIEMRIKLQTISSDNYNQLKKAIKNAIKKHQGLINTLVFMGNHLDELDECASHSSDCEIYGRVYLIRLNY